MIDMTMSEWITAGLLAIVAIGIVIVLVRLSPRSNPETLARLAVAEQEVARLQNIEARCQLLEAEKADVSRQLDSLGAKSEAEQEAMQARLKELSDMRQSLTEQFKSLSQDALDRQGERFSKQSHDVLGRLLDPLRTQMTTFEKELKSTNEKTVAERATLKEQIRALTETEAQMRSETAELTRALKGDRQAQGAWGEAVLARILMQAGLREGAEFESQKSHTLADQSRLRPDVIVHLPDGQKLVVDSKVSLTAYEQYVNAVDDDARAIHLAAHQTSLRNHVKGLSEKSYQDLPGGKVDFVMMFVPIESALAAGMKAQGLLEYAQARNVMIVGPHNLLIALRTIAQVWRIERQNRNAEAIAERAGLLIDKFVGFVNDMDRLGQRLDQAHTSFQDARRKLDKGAGSLLVQTRQLEELGAKGKKPLPEPSIELLGEEDTQANQ